MTEHTHADGTTHSHGTHTHSHTQTKAVLNRLARLTGHLQSVKTMVEDGRDCAEVLAQIAAVQAALKATAKIILKDHIDHCLVDALHSGDTDYIAELSKAIEQLL